MNILIVAEKPAITRYIAALARAHWPADQLTFVYAGPFGNIHFKYPRGKALSDYPCLSEPSYKLNAWADWRCAPQVLADDGSLRETRMSKELFTEADLIVSACDPGARGAGAFDVLMSTIFNDNRALACPTLDFSALDEQALATALTSMQSFGHTRQHSLSYSRMKRYFDWNWNVNALALLGETQRRVGVPGDAPPLSKYALQLLYVLRDKPPTLDGRIIHLMNHWQGTGRYTYGKRQSHPRLGSPTSMIQILDNLLAAGLLDRMPVRLQRPLGGFEAEPYQIYVSDRGQALLKVLHPDCEDLDLPFRLNAWCEQGDAAKPAVDRYIKTFFGKQLRFLQSQPPPP